MTLVLKNNNLNHRYPISKKIVFLTKILELHLLAKARSLSSCMAVPCIIHISEKERRLHESDNTNIFLTNKHQNKYTVKLIQGVSLWFLLLYMMKWLHVSFFKRLNLRIHVNIGIGTIKSPCVGIS